MKTVRGWVFAVLLLFLLSGCGKKSETIASVPTITHPPIPTITSTVIPSTTPTETLPPTATAPPQPISTITEEILSDGSTLIIDQKFGYELIVPPDWLVINFTAGDYYYYRAKIETEYPDIADMLDMYSTADEDQIRIVFYTTNPDHVYKSFHPNFQISDPNIPELSTGTLEYLVALITQYFIELIPEITIIESDVLTNPNGVEYGMISSRFISPLPSGDLDIQQVMVLLKFPFKVIYINFTTPTAVSKTTLPIFQQIIDTIKIN